MNAQEIRERFTKFFASTGHQKVPSSSTVPDNDPTLLFTNAGMNQFKGHFTGKTAPENKRAISIQKCVRAGGKHNDLENVGLTARHHTFFEMFGNFSFGDYFKKQAIEYAWEFFTGELKIPPNRLYVTVHHSDREAYDLWHRAIGLSQERIFKKGDKDNFWEMGDYGPCGPCSEIFYDHGEKHSSFPPPPRGGDRLDDEFRYVEICNLVFMQHEKTKEGHSDLPHPSIDTGAGLERIAAILQNVYWNYETDLFKPLITTIETLTDRKYTDPQCTTSMRILADHARSTTMLITDGVIPGNEGRGHVLRRIIRRAIRHFKKLDAPPVTFHKLVPAVFEILGKEYPQNEANKALAEKFLQLEEKKFLETLDHGLKYFDQCLKDSLRGNVLSGKAAFKLYDTFGFPLDLTEAILQEKGLTVDKTEFSHHTEKSREIAKKSWKGKGTSVLDKKAFFELHKKFGNVHFAGYETTKTSQAKLLHISPFNGSNILIFDKTPFYGESGGQIGDAGQVFKGESTAAAHIHDTQKPLEHFTIHFCKDKDGLDVGGHYDLVVDKKRRERIAKNHSATHLLQSALIKVLGDHVKQAGSLVSDTKLRFDFTHMGPITPEEIAQVEALVNEQIDKRLPTHIHFMTKNDAIAKGALAFFGEKYGEKVRILQIGDVSTELCGGIHVENTSHINSFTIISETSLSSGVRRIEALTSKAAFDYLKERSNIMREIETVTHSKGQDAVKHLQSFMEELKKKNKEVNHLKERIQLINSEALFLNPEKAERRKQSFKASLAPGRVKSEKTVRLFRKQKSRWDSSLLYSKLLKDKAKASEEKNLFFF